MDSQAPPGGEGADAERRRLAGLALAFLALVACVVALSDALNYLVPFNKPPLAAWTGP